jgi:hypothetical protein
MYASPFAIPPEVRIAIESRTAQNMKGLEPVLRAVLTVLERMLPKEEDQLAYLNNIPIDCLSSMTARTTMIVSPLVAKVIFNRGQKVLPPDVLAATILNINCASIDVKAFNDIIAKYPDVLQYMTKSIVDAMPANTIIAAYGTPLLGKYQTTMKLFGDRMQSITNPNYVAPTN